jgi:hypothetical protein
MEMMRMPGIINLSNLFVQLGVSGASLAVLLLLGFKLIGSIDKVTNKFSVLVDKITEHETDKKVRDQLFLELLRGLKEGQESLHCRMDDISKDVTKIKERTDKND